jgi:serine/threonine-protein kinase
MEAIAPHRRLAGRYVLDELIATGGMATVWLGRDEVLARTVAVKCLRENLAADPVFLERFRREAAAAGRLTHPCIVNVFDAGLDDGTSYIVMEHFEGRTLMDVLDQEAPLDPARAVALLLPVLAALQCAHDAGIVHRDVKPGNILVGADGRVKVTDFGIAHAVQDAHDLTTTGALLGSVRYLAPEQVNGGEISPRTDLYSVGIVLYEALTGRPPFRAENDVAAALLRTSRDPVPPRDLRAGIPRGLEAAVMRAMARPSEARFPSADAMARDLERYGSSEPATMPQGILPVRDAGSAHAVPSSVFRSWMLVPLVVFALAAVAIVVGLALGRLRLGGPFGIRAAAPNAQAETPPPARAIRVLRAADFDPPPGDGSEHPEDVTLAIDANPDSAWATDHYASATFGNLKAGVGLFLDFGRPQTVDRVTLSSPVPGWSFQVKAGSSPDASGEPLPGNGGATTFSVGASGRVVVNLGGVRASGLLIWITRLASDGGRFAAAIRDVSVAGSPG